MKALPTTEAGSAGGAEGGAFRGLLGASEACGTGARPPILRWLAPMIQGLEPYFPGVEPPILRGFDPYPSGVDPLLSGGQPPIVRGATPYSAGGNPLFCGGFPPILQGGLLPRPGAVPGPGRRTLAREARRVSHATTQGSGNDPHPAP